MEPKVIAMDLDGTLLGDDKEISCYAQRVLRQCKARGMRLVLATARPLQDSKRYAEQVAADGLIFHNGAYTWAEGALQEPGYTIPIGDARRVLLELQRRHPGRRLLVQIGAWGYANYDPGVFWPGCSYIPTDFTDLPEQPADKMLLEVGAEAQAMQEVQDLLPPDLYGQRCDGILCAVMHKGATKHRALERLVSRWGCSLQDVLAFGDDVNDEGMLRSCGLGVAMGNAQDRVKAAAGDRAGSNEQDGVAHYLQERLGLQVESGTI